MFHTYPSLKYSYSRPYRFNINRIHGRSTSCMYSSIIWDVFNFLRYLKCSTSFSRSKNIFSFNFLPPHPETQTLSLLPCSFFSIFFYFFFASQDIFTARFQNVHMSLPNMKTYILAATSICYCCFIDPTLFFRLSHRLTLANSLPQSNSPDSCRVLPVLELER